VKKGIARARKSARPALHRHAAVLAELALAELRQVFQTKINIVCHEQIEPAVVVIIAERGAGRPAAVSDSRFFGNVGESPIAVIVIEVIASQTGDVDIDPSIAIVIAGCHSHGPTRIGQPRLFGNVGKRAVAIVVVERAPAALWVGRGIHGQ
jgi:hypothetical protein